MTETDDELEALLRGLPLRRPPAGLDGRIAASVRRRWHPARWATAAVVLLAVGVAWRWPRAGSVAVVGHPVSVERETSVAVDDGIVSADGRVPLRQVRRQVVREIWWTDPATGAKLWAQLPTERLTVEPAETF